MATITRTPTFQPTPKSIGKKCKDVEVTNPLTTTLSSVLLTPKVSPEPAGGPGKMKRVKFERDITNPLITTLSLVLLKPPIRPEALSTRKRFKLLNLEPLTNPLISTLSTVVPLPPSCIEIVQARKKFKLLNQELIINLNTSVLDYIIVPRFHKLPSIIKVKKVKQQDEIFNLLTSTLATPIINNPTVQIELDRLKVQSKKLQYEAISNILLTTLGYYSYPLIQQELLVSNRKIGSVRQKIHETINLLTSTLGVVSGTGYSPTIRKVFQLTRSISVTKEVGGL